MKIKTLIKADFFCNPEKYGFDEKQPFSLDEVWGKVIKVNIIEFDETKKIELNSLTPDYIEGCREFFKEYIEEWYEMRAKDNVTETNKLKRAWIWFWYNDITRLGILLGLPIIPVVFVVGFVFGFDEYLWSVAMFTYAFMFVWMLLDNDYSNLRRIGLDEYRNKM